MTQAPLNFGQYPQDNPNVEWRNVPGYRRYQVSNIGEFRRVVRIGNFLPALIKGWTNARGYVLTTIQSDEGIAKKLGIHQIVMLAFEGIPPKGMCVCHNNGNSSDNRLSNLRYDTHLANNHDRFKHGTVPFGEGCVVSVITESIAIEIYKRCILGERQADIANDYGITQACVCDVFRRKTWKHLGFPRIKHVRRFGASEIAKMASMFASGINKSAIGREFKTSPQAVFYCLKKQELAA